MVRSTPPALRPNDPVRFAGEPVRVKRILGQTACIITATGERYVRLDELTPALPAACPLDLALDFVARAEADAANEGGRSIATPLPVLRALRDAVREVRRAG